MVNDQVDWNIEEAEEELDEYVEKWVKRYKIRFGVIVDILKRQTENYCLRKKCQDIEQDIKGQ